MFRGLTLNSSLISGLGIVFSLAYYRATVAIEEVP